MSKARYQVKSRGQLISKPSSSQLIFNSGDCDYIVAWASGYIAGISGIDSMKSALKPNNIAAHLAAAINNPKRGPLPLREIAEEYGVRIEAAAELKDNTIHLTFAKVSP